MIMKKIIITLLLTLIYSLILCTTINETNAYQVTEYKGVQVTHDEGVCERDIWWCYFYWGKRKWTINMNPHDSEEEYINTLNHEIWHDIWFDRMTNKERNMYIYFERGKYDEQLEEKWILMWQCNVSDYAMQNESEDFAETVMYYYMWWHRDTIEDKCDLKILLVSYYINKYN